MKLEDHKIYGEESIRHSTSETRIFDWNWDAKRVLRNICTPQFLQAMQLLEHEAEVILFETEGILQQLYLDEKNPVTCSVGPSGSPPWSRLSSVLCCPSSSWDLCDNISMPKRIDSADPPNPVTRKRPGSKGTSLRPLRHQCTDPKSLWPTFIDSEIRDQLCPLSPFAFPDSLFKPSLSKGRDIKRHFATLFLLHLYGSPYPNQPLLLYTIVN